MGRMRKSLWDYLLKSSRAPRIFAIASIALVLVGASLLDWRKSDDEQPKRAAAYCSDDIGSRMAEESRGNHRDSEVDFNSCVTKLTGIDRLLAP